MLKDRILLLVVIIVLVFVILSLACLTCPGQIPFLPGWRITKAFEFKGDAPFSKMRVFRDGKLKAEGWINLKQGDRLLQDDGEWYVLRCNRKQERICFDISTPHNHYWLSVPLVRLHLVKNKQDVVVQFD